MDEVDVKSVERKFLAHCLEMLQDNIDFTLRNANFGIYTSEMCGALKRVQLAIIEARNEYVSQIRISHDYSPNLFNM